MKFTSPILDPQPVIDKPEKHLNIMLLYVHSNVSEHAGTEVYERLLVGLKVRRDMPNNLSVLANPWEEGLLDAHIGFF
jgi:hypothetical protein